MLESMLQSWSRRSYSFESINGPRELHIHLESTVHYSCTVHVDVPLLDLVPGRILILLQSKGDSGTAGIEGKVCPRAAEERQTK